MINLVDKLMSENKLHDLQKLHEQTFGVAILGKNKRRIAEKIAKALNGGGTTKATQEPSSKTPCQEKLETIQDLERRRDAAFKVLTAARSRQRTESREALERIEEEIENSRDCEIHEATAFLVSIHKLQDERKATLEETAQEVREAQAAANESDKSFFTAIRDSRQGDLFTTEEA